MSNADLKMILIAGASGYVGGRLLGELEKRGRQVRCLVRRPEVLKGRVSNRTEIYKGDVLDVDSMDRAMKSIHTAYYLVHSLGAEDNFEAIEEKGARCFAASAKRNGVKRVVYLGGLCDSSKSELSPHLRSRNRVGDILRESGVPTTEFRASVIIGSGSLSFELIRALVNRLPVMITPRWVSVKAQPIGITDVIEYLVAALLLPEGTHRTYEIGGGDTMSYGDLIKEYARIRGLKRLLIKVPILTPRLSSLWLGLVTPLYSRIGRRLIESMTVPSVVVDRAALTDFTITPLSAAQAINQALRNEDLVYAETHWADALSNISAEGSWTGTVFGHRIVDCRSIHVDTTPEQAFTPIQRIGGHTGWYYGNWLWKIRGVVDRLLGGVGMHRGRRDDVDLRVGDVVDCWRVESIEFPYHLTLAAEMKLPGRAWLKYDVQQENGGALVTQTAVFDPVGLLGLLYWYLLCVVHHFFFCGMLRKIGLAAEAGAETCVTSREH
jgi:uncharacterized protein YbjT (DUF2867 family)